MIKLHRADLDRARGLAIPRICQKLGISEHTYFRWRKKQKKETATNLQVSPKQ